MKRRHYGTSTKKSTAWPTGKDCFCTFTSMRVSLSSFVANKMVCCMEKNGSSVSFAHGLI